MGQAPGVFVYRGPSVCTVIESDAVSFDNGAQAQELSGVSGSASLKDQTLFLTLTNSHAEHEAEVTLGLLGGAVANGGTARVLTGEIHAHNTFEALETIQPSPMALGVEGRDLVLNLPSAPVVAVEMGLA
jgi:alpha-N-arabinofuranosidase